MLVNFCTKGDVNIASYRMRSATPAHLLNGHPDYSADVSKELNLDADVTVFSKHWNMKHDADAITQCLGKTVFDVCDDYFDRDHAEYYEYMCDKADVVTCNTDRMQERIYECTGRLARIINDPVTFPKGSFRYNNQVPKILWFGNAVNLFSVGKIWNDLPNLTIVSNLQLDTKPDHVTSLLWAPGLVEDLISEYDIVVIPRNHHPWALTKSPNRAVDAIAAGKFVVTDFEEVYDCLDPYIWIGDIKDGVDYYMNNGRTIETAVKAGQAWVQQEYGHEKVLDQWIEAINAEKEV